MFQMIFHQNAREQKCEIVRFNCKYTVLIYLDRYIVGDTYIIEVYKIVSLDKDTKGCWFKIISSRRNDLVKRNYFPKWVKPFASEFVDFLNTYLKTHNVEEHKIRILRDDDKTTYLSRMIGDNTDTTKPITDEIVEYVDSLFANMDNSRTMRYLYSSII